MFLRRNYRDRALGLLGAFAILACGIAWQGMPTQPHGELLRAAPAVRPQMPGAGVLSSVPDSHCDEIC
jgi:hypothetical protein